ncbi:MAG TPA: FkbM family methyltransferase [Pirellulales bacterium]|nr:FkbM family methyltransferase [Pirellulales bacterium]
MSLMQYVIPRQARSRLKQAVGLQQLHKRVHDVERALPTLADHLRHLEKCIAEPSDPRLLIPVPPWYDPQFCEPTVAMALRDLCRPGDVVFDVGAHAGSLSLLMSRLVGLTGSVWSFEASRRMVITCQHNLVLNGCNNVQLFHKAVFATSNEAVKIYHTDANNDTIMETWPHNETYDEVETVALDDFVEHGQVYPSLIKLDIEGAEYDALKGSERLLAGRHPMLIVEQQPPDSPCFAFLRERGYTAIDLSTYREVRTPDDYPTGAVVVNVLYIHQSQIDRSPYRPPLQGELVQRIGKDDFLTEPNGDVRLKRRFDLETGRYLVATEIVAGGPDNEVHIGVQGDRTDLLRYHGDTAWLAQSYRDWIIDLRRKKSIDLFVRFLRGSCDPGLEFKSAAIYRFPALSNLRRLDFA